MITLQETTADHRPLLESLFAIIEDHAGSIIGIDVNDDRDPPNSQSWAGTAEEQQELIEDLIDAGYGDLLLVDNRGTRCRMFIILTAMTEPTEIIADSSDSIWLDDVIDEYNKAWQNQPIPYITIQN